MSGKNNMIVFLALGSEPAAWLTDLLQIICFSFFSFVVFTCFPFRKKCAVFKMSRFAICFFGFFFNVGNHLCVGWVWGSGGGGGGGKRLRRWLVYLAVCGWRSSRHIIRCLSSVSFDIDVLVCLFFHLNCADCFLFGLLCPWSRLLNHVVCFFCFVLWMRLNRNKRIWWWCLDLVAADHCLASCNRLTSWDDSVGKQRLQVTAYKTKKNLLSITVVHNLFFFADSFLQKSEN